LNRQGKYATKFWIEQKEAAEKTMQKTTRAMKRARMFETQAISVVSGNPINMSVPGINDMTDRGTRENDESQWRTLGRLATEKGIRQVDGGCCAGVNGKVCASSTQTCQLRAQASLDT